MVDLLQVVNALKFFRKLVTAYTGKELLIYINKNGNNEELEVQKSDIYIEGENLIIKDFFEEDFSYCIDVYDVIDFNMETEEFDIDCFIGTSWGIIHINSFA